MISATLQLTALETVVSVLQINAVVLQDAPLSSEPTVVVLRPVATTAARLFLAPPAINGLIRPLLHVLAPRTVTDVALLALAAPVPALVLHVALQAVPIDLAPALALLLPAIRALRAQVC